jgi:hypothetical protein
MVSASGNVSSTAARDIVGIWRLVATKATDENGKEVARPYGPRSIGIVALSADGRMTNVLVDGRGELPAGTRREHNSYCGFYSFDGSTLVTEVDAAADPARMGTKQVRKVRFDGERMILMPPVLEVNGVKVTRELTWEKISSISL